MIIEKITTNEEIALYEICRNPVLFGEFFLNYDLSPLDSPIELDWYQKEFLLDFSNYVEMTCGRAVGKTYSLTVYLIWLTVFNVFPGEYATYHVPGRNHVEPVFTNLVKYFRTNSFLKNFIPASSGINQSDYKITLLNQSALLCRIAGQTGTGVSVVGLHTPIAIVDEHGYYPWGTWLELQMTLNTFTPGFKLIASGVPDGRREKSVCYHVDMENNSYSKHRISSLLNPRFTDEDKQRAIVQYGGEDSQDYVHQILGQHGTQVFSLFDRALMDIQPSPVSQLVMNGIQMGDDIGGYLSKINLVPRLDQDEKCIMGLDLGYSEPSAFIIMTLDKYKRLHFHARIRLEKVSFPVQERIIDALDDRFHPFLIGIDKGAGGQGISLIQHLMEHEDYAHKKYKEIIEPVDFSTWTVIGIDGDGQELKQKTKPLAVSILQDYTNNHRIVYSSMDVELITELERMTYTRSPSGDISYHTFTSRGGMRGEDHFTSALLVLVTSYYLRNEFIQARTKVKKLISPSWH